MRARFIMATRPTAVANIMYQAGASALPVACNTVACPSHAAVNRLSHAGSAHVSQARAEAKRILAEKTLGKDAPPAISIEDVSLTS